MTIKRLALAVVVILGAVAAFGSFAQQTLAQGGEGDPAPTGAKVDYGTVEFTRDDFNAARESTLIFSPSTQPEVFVDCIDNPYFPLIPGTVYHYEVETDEGLETTTLTVTNETREIMGITATVVHDVVALDGEVTENTWDWFAQDDRGNVWYLGEDTQELENGEVVSTAGSWEAGVDGAIPGILMLGEPRPGDMYYEEYYAGEAEDMAAVTSLSESVTVPLGTFDDALQTTNFNPLDDELEEKWYVEGIGVVQDSVVGEDAANQLVEVTLDRSQWDPGRACNLTEIRAHIGSASGQQ